MSEDRSSRASLEEKSPRPARAQDAPQQERMVTPLEEVGEELEAMENPPQAEGPRDRVEEDLREKR